MGRGKGKRAQLELPHTKRPPKRRGRGGARKGAGRKPRPENAKRGLVKHRTRPEHDHRHPVHVTLRVQKLLERTLDRAKKDGCQVVHYSIQRDHLHLIVEADDKRALSSGMRRVVIAFARRFNREVRRRNQGKVWGDRYHRHDLATPREVRNALVYVFTNAAKHGEHGASPFTLDRLSSARAFDGWDGLLPKTEAFRGTTEPWRPPDAKTWLLRTGWKRINGPIVLGDAAKAVRDAWRARA